MGKLTGKKIKALRHKLGMTQPELAKAVGVSKMSIINWEMDRRKPMRIAYERLEQVLRPATSVK